MKYFEGLLIFEKVNSNMCNKNNNTITIIIVLNNYVYENKIFKI